jgi:hypothetical protein
VIHSDGPSKQLDPIKIIHSQHSTPLIGIGEETEAAGFAGSFVPCKVDFRNISIPMKINLK